jgi:hypothetical protein
MEFPGFYDIEEIGRGGMATVYRAVHAETGQVQAIKLMLATLVGDASLVERFLDEGRTHAGFTHPQIIQIFEVAQLPDGRPYFTMEYLDGETLKDYLAREGRIAPADAVSLLVPIMDALDYVHERRFVHRDVKPENIFICQDRGAVLMDFGIIRDVDRSTRFTEAGMAVGTPHYMSPEQARGEATDHRSDIYAMGIVFYEMITGHVPFDGKDSFAIAIKHIQENLPLLPEDLGAFQALIHGAMEKDVAARYASIGAFKADLERVMAGKKTSHKLKAVASATGNKTMVIPAVGAKPTGRKLLVAAVVVLALAVAGGGAWFWQRGAATKSVRFSGGGGALPEQQVGRVPAVAQTRPSQAVPSAPSVGSKPSASSSDLGQILAGGSVDSAEKQQWKDALGLETQEPGEAFGTLLSLLQLPALPKDVSRHELQTDFDRVAQAMVKNHLAGNRLLSPADNSAAQVLVQWQPFCGQADVLKDLMQRGVRQYLDLGEQLVSKGDLERAESSIDRAKKFAGLVPGIKLEGLFETDIQQLRQRISVVRGKREQKNNNIVLAKKRVEEAWRLLDGGDPWQAQEKVAAAETLNVSFDSLTAVKRSVQSALRQKQNEAQGLLTEAQKVMAQERYTRVLEICSRIVASYPRSGLDLSLCDEAKDKKAQIANVWQSQSNNSMTVSRKK